MSDIFLSIGFIPLDADGQRHKTHELIYLENDVTLLDTLVKEIGFHYQKELEEKINQNFMEPEMVASSDDATRERVYYQQLAQ